MLRAHGGRREDGSRRKKIELGEEREKKKAIFIRPRHLQWGE
jgi:hypothetical protein